MNMIDVIGKQIIEKDYQTELGDYANGKELTVEITLHEYRDLITFKATGEKKISDADHRRWEAENKLKTANTELDGKVAELATVMDKLTEMELKYNELEMRYEHDVAAKDNGDDLPWNVVPYSDVVEKEAENETV